MMVKFHKKILVLFIICFIFLLLIPNVGLLNEKKHQAEIAKENRKITAFPRFGWTDKRLYSQFENWYKDRLRGRERAIKMWKEYNYKFGVILDKDIFRGKNKWLFSRRNRIIGLKDGAKKMQEVAALQNYCKDHGAEFMLLVPPTKEAFYIDEFPLRERKNVQPYAFWDKQLQQLAMQEKVNYLDVNDKLLQAQKTGVPALYFSDDHHWSYYGAEIAADSFLRMSEKLMNRKFYFKQPMDMVFQSAYKEASYAHRLGYGQTWEIDAPYSSKFTDEIYLVDCYTGKETKVKKIVSNNVLWGPINNGEAIIKNKDNPHGIKILMLGDSYSSYMAPYLIQYASKIVSTHYRDCAGRKKEVNLARLIAKYQPDVVLLEILGNSFYQADSIAKIKLK